MKAIACVDDGMGLSFNKRRQSSDKVVTKKILELAGDKKLYAEPYSQKLLETAVQDLAADTDIRPELQFQDDFLEAAGADNSNPEVYCFTERKSLQDLPKDKMDELVLFYWNRRYPSDVKLGLDLNDWEEINTYEYPGNSHEKITEVHYVPKA